MKASYRISAAIHEFVAVRTEGIDCTKTIELLGALVLREEYRDECDVVYAKKMGRSKAGKGCDGWKKDNVCGSVLM